MTVKWMCNIDETFVKLDSFVEKGYLGRWNDFLLL